MLWSHLCLRLHNAFVTLAFTTKSMYTFLHPLHWFPNATGSDMRISYLFPFRGSLQEPKIHISIILPSTPSCTKWSILVGLTSKALPFLRICLVPADGAGARSAELGYLVFCSTTWCSIPKTAVKIIPTIETIDISRSYLWHIFIGAKSQYGGHANFYLALLLTIAARRVMNVRVISQDLKF